MPWHNDARPSLFIFAQKPGLAAQLSELLRTIGNRFRQSLAVCVPELEGNTLWIGIDIAAYGPHRCHRPLEVGFRLLTSHVLDAAGIFRQSRHKRLNFFDRPLHTLPASLLLVGGWRLKSGSGILANLCPLDRIPERRAIQCPGCIDTIGQNNLSEILAFTFSRDVLNRDIAHIRCYRSRK
ncbi:MULTISPECIES: hypothetical protein [unclassified Ensifer]|uniref:hypothetical protein n=1 Tax=unclassified Ensifer TaxID=2633371 RepID=UPI00070D8841|nr:MULTISPECIES: hypothetical protein [unclassified Ensifer]KQW60545.1 hypothetical protein ASD02_25485 [Ensifer sp. Root1252]KRC79374.1 hypothetical protein ASE32_26020 [Ensifer sp. Root231]KRC99766.1 hypothetical protein ASE47_26380 [Ensifer sp. Root258]